MTLWHYTCGDHGVDSIRAMQWLIPFPHRLLPDPLVWLTDLDSATPEWLGLHTHILTSCNRMAYRVEVDAPEALPWHAYAHPLSRALRNEFEWQMTLPMHWWVSTAAVQVVDIQARTGASWWR